MFNIYRFFIIFNPKLIFLQNNEKNIFTVESKQAIILDGDINYEYKL